MKRTSLMLSALLFGIATLVLVTPAQAAPPGRILPSIPHGGYHPQMIRPIGWDWWRTYPYSAYNYGRNPYNPIIYPYAMPYPVYGSDSGPDMSPAPLPVPPVGQEQTMTPHPTGDLREPPANAALIKVRVPAEFAQVDFNGVKVSSVGKSRSYVTPELPGGKAVKYAISATWKIDGRSVSQEQQVDVIAGKTLVVDFTR